MTNANNETLLPCPFCGSTLIKPVQHGHTDKYTVSCGSCGAWSSRFLCELNPLTKVEAIAAWNTRATPTQLDKTEVDWEELAYEMADAMGKMLLRLRHTSDWIGTLQNPETGERYSWEEMFARLIERIPGLEVDRRYFEAKELPAKQRRARYQELDKEMAEKRKAAAEASHD